MNITYVINNLGNSDLSYYCIKNISDISKDTMYSVGILYKNLFPPIREIDCAVMNISAISSISGKAIATDLETLELLSKTTSKTDKYFYVWNLEWLFAPYDYFAIRHFMRDVKLIARSESDKQIIENYTGKSCDFIVKDFNWEELKKCLI